MSRKRKKGLDLQEAVKNAVRKQTLIQNEKKKILRLGRKVHGVLHKFYCILNNV